MREKGKGESGIGETGRGMGGKQGGRRGREGDWGREREARAKMREKGWVIWV